MISPSRGSAIRNRTGNSPLSISLTDIPVGAYMILAAHIGDAVTGISIPEGWVQLTPRQPTGSRSVWYFARIKENPAEVSVTFNSTANVGRDVWLIWGIGASEISDWVVGPIGVRNASNVISGTSVQAGDGNTSVAPTITMPREGLVISVLTEATAATEPTHIPTVTGATLWAHSPFSLRETESEILAYVEMSSAGITEDVSSTYPNAQVSNGSGIQIGIPSSTKQLGVPVRLVSATARLTIINEEEERVVPKRAALLRPGFDSVENMLTTPGVTWAHRGGSGAFPEMAEWSYDQSALLGFGVLEFSAQRSSDGWWFGLHDNSLERTTPGSGSATPATYSRAQLELLKNSTGLYGGDRPYYGLVEFLQKWTPTHVVVVDCKNSLEFNSEFLDLLDQNGGPEKIIWKWYGVGSSILAQAQAAKNRGYETWGYFYPADVSIENGGSGALASSEPYWSFLGMTHAASQAIWDEVLSYGKPTVAHIAKTQADYDSAISKGADMVQCSGVLEIRPVSR